MYKLARGQQYSTDVYIVIQTGEQFVWAPSQPCQTVRFLPSTRAGHSMLCPYRSGAWADTEGGRQDMKVGAASTEFKFAQNSPRICRDRAKRRDLCQALVPGTACCAPTEAGRGPTQKDVSRI
jgi:hypothetical protein